MLNFMDNLKIPTECRSLAQRLSVFPDFSWNSWRIDRISEEFKIASYGHAIQINQVWWKDVENRCQTSWKINENTWTSTQYWYFFLGSFFTGRFLQIILTSYFSLLIESHYSFLFVQCLHLILHLTDYFLLIPDLLLFTVHYSVLFFLFLSNSQLIPYGYLYTFIYTLSTSHSGLLISHSLTLISFISHC